MLTIFNSEINPRQLTIEQQNEYAKIVAKYELVEYLVQQENLIKGKYEQALFIGANNEIENYKVMLNVIDMALKYTLN